jgi:hypothetical protein
VTQNGAAELLPTRRSASHEDHHRCQSGSVCFTLNFGNVIDRYRALADLGLQAQGDTPGSA